ncbi:MAG: tRNA (adenosine(37)-N6)-dimethylallyltransferase MiaA, partial [Coriobacteriales bacterium]|nr:tRNA (adenosine(37)-N6)-dimethylallyltransferase MiaA [Coriobacteriales bacterium]
MAAPDVVIAVVGATATGKSALADALAGLLGGEVISADSMQVYRGMDLGTAKLAPDCRSVPHHCIDLVEPDEPYSAARYQHDARAAIDRLHAGGRVPVVCGGTGLYVRAALDDFSFDESASVSASAASSASSEAPRPDAAELRERLNTQAAALGPEAFHALLAAHDADSAALIHPNNVRRAVRAFELLAQGRRYADVKAGFSRYCSFYPTSYLGINVE